MDARTATAAVKRARFAFTALLQIFLHHRHGNRAVSPLRVAASRSLALRPRLAAGLPLASRQPWT